MILKKILSLRTIFDKKVLPEFDEEDESDLLEIEEGMENESYKEMVVTQKKFSVDELIKQARDEVKASATGGSMSKSFNDFDPLDR